MHDRIGNAPQCVTPTVVHAAADAVYAPLPFVNRVHDGERCIKDGAAQKGEGQN